MSPTLRAQTFRGSINGVVTDQSGAVVAAAQVEATDVATGIAHTTITSSGGEFSFQDLPLGSYSVSATASGFQKIKVDKVPVTAGTVYTLPIKLGVAQTATTIEVNAAALTLDTTSTTQTAGVGGKPLQDTPLNGRDFTQLIILSPGFSNSGAGGFGSLNGTRANQINWQIDGIDNNDLWHNIPAVNQGGVSGIAGIVLPIDAVDQFSAQTQASPESGRNPGGSVNLSLKSGGNQLHGSLYYYNRNEFFGATNPFTAPVKQEVRNYNYGFSAGGPFIKDKLFWFTTFEHQRFTIGVPNNATEPTQGYQSAAEATLAKFGVPVNPLSAKLLSTLWPADAVGAGPASPNNYTSTQPEYGYSYNGLAKVDYTINDKNSLTAHWFVGQGNQVAPVTGSSLFYYYEVAPIHVQNYAIVYNHVFTPTITNQVLAGVNYFNQVFNDFNNSFDSASLGLVTGSGLAGSPNIQISGFDQVGLTPPEGRNDITGHLTDDLSWTVGKHQFKFGGEFRKAQLDEFYHRHALGSFIFDGTQGPTPQALNPATGLPAVAWDSGDPRVDALSDFLAGNLKTGSIALGDPDRQVFVNTLDFFAQDSWQLSPKFNVNYGLRWDYEGPLHNQYKNLSVFRPNLGGIVYQGAGIDSLYDSTYTDFSPRFGFSYQVTPSTVVRAGAGLYFDTPNLNPFLDNRPGNGAPNGVEGNPGGPNPVVTATAVPQTLMSGVDPFTQGTPSNSLFSIAKNFVPSRNVNYNFQVEQSLSNKLVAQIGYVGSEGRHLLSILDINQAALSSVYSAPGFACPAAFTPQNCSRPYFSQFPNDTFINQIESIGTSNYNSLQATIRASGYHGLTLQAAYTWSHSFDEVTAYRGALPQDSTNFKGDYGPSDFDNRNIFDTLITYEVPGSQHWKPLTKGWQLNSLMTFHGGLPFSVYSSADTSGTDDGNQRANPVAGVDPYAGFRKGGVGVNWLNPAAFADAPAGTWGTTSRNAYYGPGFGDVDFSVFKNTPIGERVTTQFRVEMFNLFNRTNYAPPLNGNFNPSYTQDNALTLFTTIGSFNGAPGIGAGEPFNTQLALKIIF
ncbi:outer membrane receptor protein involved in Fe transport [Silvibacterium bohemicum]|uniref:Outer membrane receptor protein involved in Fe transport n=1 Tax=Silvibacterium bohemicum TaxID=1577686 RepID=A0A841JUK2_9BACT|nr:TonB-dependent receptor [Silvibacterium bohemicum]MBB6145072.1 outer membrane receptor protein involved in Fe transport [Silvibacterium bohemicum]